MRIAMLVVDFHLEGCRSLKEKRRRLSGLRDRFGRQSNLAVCESDFQDAHDRAQWSFIAVGADGQVVDKTLSGVEEYLDEEIDGMVTNVHRENL